MKTFWRFLLALFALGVDDDPAAAAGGDGAADPNQLVDELIGEGDDDTPDLDALPPEDDDTPAAKPRKTAREIELEAENRTLRETRAAPAPAPAARPVDVDFQREEEELDKARQSGDPAVLKWTQFHVDTSRKVRATERNSNAALARAEDLLDKTAFDRLEITRPDLYKRYAPKVEEALQKLHEGGSYPSRQLVLRMLIGEDIMKGNVKSAKKTKAATTEPQVPRGRSPATRGDVSAKTRLSDHQKRIERLRDQVI